MQAAVIFSIRPLSGFPAPSPAPQANPAFPIWSCGTLHKNFSFFIGKWFFRIKSKVKEPAFSTSSYFVAERGGFEPP